MSIEKPPTREDAIAERLAKLGTWATILSLVILVGVLFGNVLVLAVKVAINAVLAVLVNQGPAVAALFGGISTAIGYYGRTRLLRGKEKFSLRDEVTDQALDQAGNALQNAPAALRSRLGCSSTLSLGAFAASLILCFLTYLPPPLHVFGANQTVASATPVPTMSTATAVATETATLTVAVTDTATAAPIATTIVPTPPPAAKAPPVIATATFTAVPTRIPTATTVPPPPGNLLILPPTTIDLGYSCGDRFGYPTSNNFFSFTNTGGTPIYWTVTMPSGLFLVQNYPVSGSLQPYQADRQNEYFQGTKVDATITVQWGYSSASEPYSAAIPVTCAVIR